MKTTNNMHKALRYILISGFTSYAGSLFAQDSLKANVFQVDKFLKPLLSESMKIPSNPNPEVPEIKTPVFEYNNIPDTSYGASPTLYTIKPLAMGTSLLPKLKSDYIKLGYGNYNTPLAEVYLNTVRNKNLQAGFFAKHLSSSPDGDNTFSNNVVYGYAKKCSAKGVLSTDVYYYRNRVNLYGKPDNSTATASDIKQLFNTFDIHGAYNNIVKDTNSLGYRLGASYYYFSGPLEITENDFKLNADFNKRIQGNPLEVKTQLDIVTVKNTAAEYQRVFVDINPRYTLNMDVAYLKLGFNSTIFSDSSTSKVYFFPVAEAGYSIIPKSFTAFVGITGNVQRNTFKSIANENPFTRGLGFNNTVNKFEVYGGFKGMISPQTSFLLQAGISKIENMMFYVVDSSDAYSQRVIFNEPTANLTNIKAELTHEFDDKFRVAFAMNYYNYGGLKLEHPYSRPTFETKFNAMYNMGDKFIFRTDIFTMNKRYAQVFGATGSQDQTLKGLVDLNLGIDYLYNKNVSVFLNLNNVTNNTYQRWYAYPVYGFNLLGGLTITF
jgi:hypothetical protein